LQYLRTYDLYEAKANEWIIKIKEWNEHQISLENLETLDILPTSQASIENENYINKGIVGEKIYSYNGKIFYFLKVIIF